MNAMHLGTSVAHPNGTVLTALEGGALWPFPLRLAVSQSTFCRRPFGLDGQAAEDSGKGGGLEKHVTGVT